MSIFNINKAQDDRLEAIESWLQGLTGVVQKQQVDTAELRLELMKLQTQIDVTQSETDFDPLFMQLNDKIAEARSLALEASVSSEDAWLKLQSNIKVKLENLDEKLLDAA